MELTNLSKSVCTCSTALSCFLVSSWHKGVVSLAGVGSSEVQGSLKTLLIIVTFVDTERAVLNCVGADKHPYTTRRRTYMYYFKKF